VCHLMWTRLNKLKDVGQQNSKDVVKTLTFETRTGLKLSDRSKTKTFFSVITIISEYSGNG